MQIIPFISDPASVFTVELGGTRVVLETRFNERSQSSTLDITRDSD